MPQRGNHHLRPIRTDDQKLYDVLGEMTDEEVVCRSGSHQWALDSVMPGETWPEAVQAWPGHLGVFRIEDPCLRCGMAWRTQDTLPGGEMNAYAEVHIRYDRDWVKVPRGLDRRKKRLREEKYLRGGNKNAAQVRMAAARVAAEESRQATAPATGIRFSGVS